MNWGPAVLVASAVVLIVGGMLALVYWIPNRPKDAAVKTEFYSARAAHACVWVGLIIFLLFAVGVVTNSIIRQAHDSSRREQVNVFSWQ